MKKNRAEEVLDIVLENEVEPVLANHYNDEAALVNVVKNYDERFIKELM